MSPWVLLNQVHTYTHTHMQTCSSKKKQWFRVCATLTDGSQNTVLQQPITIIEIPGSWEMIGQGPVWLRPTQNTVFRVFIRDFVQSLNRHQSLEVHLIGNIKLYFPTRQSWTWAQNDIELQWGRSVYKAPVIIVVVVVVIVVGVVVIVVAASKEQKVLGSIPRRTTYD